MTNTTLDLQRMGLVSLSEFETLEIDGGNIWKWIGDHAVDLASLAVSVVSLIEQSKQ